MIQAVEAVNSMPLSKGSAVRLVAEANCAKPSVCHPCGNFYYNTQSFLPSLYHSKPNPLKVAEFLTPFGTF